MTERLITQELLAAQDTDEWTRWHVRKPLTFQGITVPVDFSTDGASIPRALWWFLPTWGRYARAAVVHDYLYSLIRMGVPHSLASTRRAADKVFFDGMVDTGVNTTIRWLMWAMVRIFGRFTV